MLPLQQNAKPFNTRKDIVTEHSHIARILLSILHEGMEDYKQISSDEPSVTEIPVVREIMENYIQNCYFCL